VVVVPWLSFATCRPAFAAACSTPTPLQLRHRLKVETDAGTRSISARLAA